MVRSVVGALTARTGSSAGLQYPLGSERRLWFVGGVGGSLGGWFRGLIGLGLGGGWVGRCGMVRRRNKLGWRHLGGWRLWQQCRVKKYAWVATSWRLAIMAAVPRDYRTMDFYLWWCAEETGLGGDILAIMAAAGPRVFRRVLNSAVPPDDRASVRRSADGPFLCCYHENGLMTPRELYRWRD